jgi:Protein of unknown function (DUF3347).
MRNILIVIILLVIVIAGWRLINKTNNAEEARQNPIKVSKHSPGFNASVGTMLDAYYGLTESLVNWDSVSAQTKAKSLKEKINSLQLDELKKDSGAILETANSFLSDSKSNLDSIAANTGITAQRDGLNSLTQNLYDFLRVVKYDESKLYLQLCPMAFNNETSPGVWLSKTDSIINPYMGIHHPHYGKGMIHCGETKDTLNFMPQPKNKS